MEHKGRDQRFWKGGQRKLGRGLREALDLGLRPVCQAARQHVGFSEGACHGRGDATQSRGTQEQTPRTARARSEIAGSMDGTSGWRGRQRSAHRQLKTAQGTHS